MADAIQVTASSSALVELAHVEDPQVSVVIVTYGECPSVIDTISSLRRHTRERSFEVIVVANPKEKARSTRLLRHETAGVRLLEPKENLGFAGGNNLGVAHARAELVALVNPDLVVTEGWLPPLIQALEDPAVAVAAPVLLNADGSVQEAGQIIFADGGTEAIGGPRLFSGDRSVLFARDVDYASAACWLLRRSTFDALGGFDPTYHPAYYEDADLGMRVEQAGLVTRLVTDRPVFHMRGATGEAPPTEAPVTEALFRARWAAHLSTHCARPTTCAEALMARDRRCSRRTLVLLSAIDIERSQVVSVVDQVGQAAADRPRDRVTLAVDRLVDAERHRRRWCPQGLELVVGPLEQVLRERRGWATEVRWVGARAGALADGLAESAPWAEDQ